MLRRYPKGLLFELYGYSVYEDVVREFHESPARTKIISSPARTSKSYACAHDLLADFFPEFDPISGKPLSGTLGWLVGTDYRCIKEWDYLVQRLVDEREKLGFNLPIESFSNSPNQGNMRLVVNWGANDKGEPCRSILEAKSATNERSLQGEEVTYGCLSESAEHEERIVSRYLATRVRRFIYPTTPKLKAEWLRAWIDAAEADSDGRLSVEHFRFTPRCNPTYDWERYWIEHQRAESRKLDGRIVTVPADPDAECSAENGHDCFDPLTRCAAATDSFYGEQFLGLWTYEQGRVLPFRWEDRGDGAVIHVLRENPPWVDGATVIVSCDFGYDQPAVALWGALGADGTVVVISEIYESQMHPSDFVRAIHERTKELGVRVAYYVADPQSPVVQEDMRRLGLPVWDRGSKARLRDRRAGGLAVVDAFSSDPMTGLPKLFVTTACPKTIHEWKVLRRKQGWVGDEWGTGAFGKCRDDAFDAIRYLLMSRPGAGRKEDQDWLAEHLRLTRKMKRMHAEWQEPTPLIGRTPRTTAEIAHG